MRSSSTRLALYTLLILAARFEGCVASNAYGNHVRHRRFSRFDPVLNERTEASAMTKERHSRRGFMGLTGAGLAGAVAAPWFGATPVAAAAADADADLVVFNAKV